MKLLRLGLIRYGPFADTDLEFRSDAALHIVYGRNEAGKSSALAAITDLLYGFQLRSTANFRHHSGDLLVEAHMQQPDGRVLVVRRRKRNKHSLTDEQDSPLDDTVFEPVLGGISRQIFLSAFGLGQEGLREGAQQMLEAGGELGQTLFVAASGLKTLLSTRKKLDEEAAALFSRQKHTALREAQASYDNARMALREKMLKADDVLALDEQIAGLRARADAITARQTEAMRRQALLHRVRRIGPILRQIDSDEAALAELAGLPALSSDFPVSIRAAVNHAEKMEDEVRRLSESLEQSRLDFDAIHVDDALLADAEAIEALSDMRATFDEAMKDIPHRQEEVTALGNTLSGLAGRLGLAPGVDLEKLRPNDLVLSRLQELIRQRRSCEEALARHEATIIHAREAVNDAMRAHRDLAGTVDPEPLRQRLKALKPQLAGLDRLAEHASNLENLRSRFAENLARLSPHVPDAERLWRWAEPSQDVLAGFERRFEALERQAANARDEGMRLEKALAAYELEIRAEETQGGLVDSVLLEREREERDQLFEAFAVQPDAARASTYRKSVMRVDALADRRLEQIESLARRELAIRNRDETIRSLEAVWRAREEVERLGKALRDEWQALFTPLGIEAGSVAGMRRFLEALTALRLERDAVAGLEVQVTAHKHCLDEERPQLEAIARDCGIEIAADMSLASLLCLVEDQLTALDQDIRKEQSTQDRLVNAQHVLARAEQEAEAARDTLQDQAQDWCTTTAAVGAGEGLSVAQAEKALELWHEIERAFVSLHSLEHRISRMQQNCDAFAIATNVLAERFLTHPALQPRDKALALMERLKEARAASARREVAGKELFRQKKAFDQAQDVLRHARLALENLAAQADWPVGELLSLADSLDKRDLLRQSRDKAYLALVQQGDGLDTAALIAEAAATSPEEATCALPAIEVELGALLPETQLLAGELHALEKRRQDMEGGSQAAEAAQRLEDARSDLERIAGDYIILKAASAMIHAGLDRQLREEQGPLLASAGRFFAAMTGEGFTDIATHYDDRAQLRLAARRADGETVEIEGLSEGTRDQLYLALRLANLEALAARRPVPPFIGDDLVITFDDERTAASLSAIAISGSPLQKILFTHHRHVVDIARRVLGDNVDIVTL